MAILHITLGTRDVERTAQFFEDAFGWPPIERPQNIGVPAAWLSIAPGQELHLVEVADFEASACEREFGRHVAVGFPRAELGRLRARLERCGAELMAPIRATDFERFFFRDPNGYVIEVVGTEEGEADH